MTAERLEGDIKAPKAEEAKGAFNALHEHAMELASYDGRVQPGTTKIANGHDGFRAGTKVFYQCNELKCAWFQLPTHSQKYYDCEQKIYDRWWGNYSTTGGGQAGWSPAEVARRKCGK